MPKSPRRAPPTKCTYCTGHERSRPSWTRMAARSASLASGAASRVAGSPVSRMRTKIVTLRMKSDASANRQRVRMKRVIGPAPSSLPQLDLLERARVIEGRDQPHARDLHGLAHAVGPLQLVDRREVGLVHYPLLDPLHQSLTLLGIG